MRSFPFVTLGIVILLLAVYGAGIFPWTLFAAAVALCLAQRPWRVVQHRPVLRLLIRSPYAYLLAYLLMMLVPLPGGLDRLSGEIRMQQNRIVTETLHAAADAGQDPQTIPLFSISRNRAGTMRFLILAVLIHGGWCITAGGTDRQRMILLRGLVAAGAFMGMAGVLGRYGAPQGDTLWWVIPVPHGLPGPMGGFMNQNHFAGFCALLTPVALALSMHDLQHRRPLPALLHLGSSTILFLSVLLSHSRGGMVALGAGVGTLLLIGMLRGNTTARIGLPVAAVLLTASALVIILRIDSVRERVLSLRSPATTASFNSRAQAWRDSFGIWRQYPLLGAGPNAFRAVYPQHRTTSARDARDFAENEYIQWLCETGIAGVLIGLLFAERLRQLVFRRVVSQEDGSPVLSFAMIAVLATAAVHALVDFPMHLPLYALTLAALTGMLSEPGPNRGTDARTSCPGEAREASAPQVNAPFFAAAGLVIVLGLSLFDIQLDSAGRIGRANLPDTARALASAPTLPVTWRHLAALQWQADTTPARLLAERSLTQAATLDPNNYLLWRHLGDRRHELGDEQGKIEAYRRVKALRSWVNVPTDLPEAP